MKLAFLLFSIVLATMIPMSQVQAQDDNQTDCILTCETENETTAEEEPSGSISSFNSGVIVVK